MAKKQNTSAPSSANTSPSTSGARRSPVSGRASAAQPRSGPVVAASSDAAQRAVANDSNGPVARPPHTEIAAVAYQRFLARGCADGYDIEDWVEAERELLQRAR